MEASTGPDVDIFPQRDVAMQRFQEGVDDDGVQDEDGDYAIMGKSRWCNFGEVGWRRRALQEFPRSQHLKVRQAVWMVMVMVGELDRIGDQGPSSAEDDKETENNK